MLYFFSKSVKSHLAQLSGVDSVLELSGSGPLSEFAAFSCRSIHGDLKGKEVVLVAEWLFEAPVGGPEAVGGPNKTGEEEKCCC
jgi:hypothetical protein